MAAETEDDARKIKVGSFGPARATWCEPEHVVVMLIGDALPDTESGVVLASFKRRLRRRGAMSGVDDIDQNACAEIRKLLDRHNVPPAAFIDDHVANAIVQRTLLALCLRRIRKDVSAEVAKDIDDTFAAAWMKEE